MSRTCCSSEESTSARLVAAAAAAAAAALAFRGRATSDRELLEISSEDLWTLVGQDPGFVERSERAAAEREMRYRTHLREQTQPGAATPHLLDGLRSRLRGVAGHAAQS
jgi:hypothetical protein